MRHFAGFFSRDNNLKPSQFTEAALEALAQRYWRGNIRELRNSVERLMVMTRGQTIDAGDVRSVLGDGSQPADRGVAASEKTLREFKEVSERRFLVRKLREHGWNISKTAEEIDTPRSNLYKKLEQYNISQETDG